mgnify:CR=1 FL=1
MYRLLALLLRCDRPLQPGDLRLQAFDFVTALPRYDQMHGDSLCDVRGRDDSNAAPRATRYSCVL